MVVLLPGGVATREVLIPLHILHDRLMPEVVWAAATSGPLPGHDPPMSFHADMALSEVTTAPDILLSPGGFGSLAMTEDEGLLESLRRLLEPPSTTVCLAISTGSLPLAAAGLLDGVRVSSHWLAGPDLERFGSIPVDNPHTQIGRVFTASGWVSAEAAAKATADYLDYGQA